MPSAIMKLAPALALAALCLARPAGAQSTGAKGPSLLETASNSYIGVAGNLPPNAEEAAKQARDLVSHVGISDVFESITDRIVVAVRHKPSGLICLDPRAVIVPKAIKPGGFDPAAQTGCILVRETVQVDVDVVPNPTHVSVETATEALSQQAIKEQSVLRQVGDLKADAPRGIARLLLTTGQDPRYLHLAVARAGDWVVLVKARCVYDSAAACERVADRALLEAVALVVSSAKEGGPKPSPKRAASAGR
jgi:hypothetical protein